MTSDQPPLGTRASDVDADALLDLAHEAVIALDYANRVLYWNKGAERAYGWSRKEALGREIDSLLCSELPLQRSRILEIAMNAGVWEGEITQARKDGSLVIVSSKWAVRLDESGKIVQTLEVNRDVTAQKQAEMDTRTVMQSAHCLLWYADVEEVGDEVLVWHFHIPDEEAAFRFLPLPTQEGQNFAQAWYGSRLQEDQALTDRQGCTAVREGRDYSVEYRCQMENGEVRWLHEDVQVETVEAGKRWRTVGVCTDISERREAEVGLRLTLQAAGVGWFAVSLVHDIAVMSEEYASMLGRRVEDYVTRTAIRTLIHPDDVPMVDEALSQGLKESRDVIDAPEARFQCADGTWVWHRATWRITYNAGEPMWITAIAVDETRRRGAEEALHEAERRYSALFANQLNGIAHCRMIVDETGKPVDYDILQVNDAYETITGLRRKDVEGKRATEVFPTIQSLDFDYIGSYGAVALHGGELMFEDYFAPLGQWLSIYAYSPTPGEFTAIFSDITARKQAEVERRQILASARCLLWFAEIGADEDGRFYRWDTVFPDSEAAERFMPIDRREGEPFYRAWHKARLPEDSKRCEMEGYRSIMAGRSYRQEFRVRLSDGSIRWMREDVHVETVQCRRQWRAVGICVDIDDLKRLQIENSKARQTLEMALDVAEVGLWLQEIPSRTLSTNAHGRRHFGLPDTLEVTADLLTQRLHPDDREAFLTADAAFNTSGETYDDKFRIVTESGANRWIHATRRKIRDETGQVVAHLGVTLDFTSVVEREQELESHVRERTEELRHAVEELQSFSSSVAHDLRAPLRAIHSSSKIILDEIGNDLSEEHRHLLKRQVANASKLAQLIDDLLKLSRVGRQPLSAETIDVTHLATEVAASYAGTNHKIEVDLGMIAMADPALLRLLLENLVGNGCKYSPKGGNIRVGSKVVRGETVFFVSDEGIGFDMQYAHKIFLPFERLHHDSEIPGTGIGLASVRRVVERHCGRVWAESEPGKGSTFYFTLG